MQAKETENKELREEIEELKLKLAKKDKEYINSMAENQNNLNDRIKQISLHFHNREQNLLKNYNNLLKSKNELAKHSHTPEESNMQSHSTEACAIGKKIRCCAKVALVVWHFDALNS